MDMFQNIWICSKTVSENQNKRPKYKIKKYPKLISTINTHIFSNPKLILLKLLFVTVLVIYPLPPRQGKRKEKDVNMSKTDHACFQVLIFHKKYDGKYRTLFSQKKVISEINNLDALPN